MLAVRPEDITLHTEAPTSVENVLTGHVQDTIYLGNFIDCRVDVNGHELRVQLQYDAEPPQGASVYLSFSSDACHSLPI